MRTQLADDVSSEDLKVFLEEVEEQIQLMGREVARLEKKPTADGLAVIFRAAHTLRGSSEMIGHRAMADVAHAMESLLDRLRSGAARVTAEVIDALLRSVDALRNLTKELASLVNDAQEDIVKSRTVPVNTALRPFPRMMRDLSRKLGKTVEFSIDDGGTEVDRMVMARVRNPLVQLLRNAIDHGVEAPGERQAAGKQPAGSIQLEVFRDHGQIVFRVTDDGRGIHPEQIKDAAIRKGLISREHADGLSGPAAVDLIFISGASTREQEAGTSGRGVGLDIVRSNIQAINGYVDVKTEPGRGSVFTIRAPVMPVTGDSSRASRESA